MLAPTPFLKTTKDPGWAVTSRWHQFCLQCYAIEHPHLRFPWAAVSVISLSLSLSLSVSLSFSLPLSLSISPFSLYLSSLFFPSLSLSPLSFFVMLYVKIVNTCWFKYVLKFLSTIKTVLLTNGGLLIVMAFVISVTMAGSVTISLGHVSVRLDLREPIVLMVSVKNFKCTKNSHYC